MPLDNTRFDTCLKKDPLWDLVFRGFAWVLISALTAHIANKRGVPLIDTLNRLAESAGPVVNLVGIASILMAVVALAAKDLEAVDPVHWGQKTDIGFIGGVVRRLAGDFMLWTLGAIVSLFTVAIVAFLSVEVASAERMIVTTSFVRLIFYVVVMGALTYLVRREQPCLALYLTKSRTLLLVGYSVIALILLLVSAA